MTTGPRIYNLFPLLGGSVDRWHEHLRRIAAMGFDWIYVNPFHQPGESGSLYAIRDFDRLHPIIQGRSKRLPDELLTRFTRAADDLGLRVMMDLVINHTASDALLVDQHPDWYVRDANGNLYAPRAVDPNNPANVTVWEDLAELDYGNGANRSAQLAFWEAYVGRMIDLGFAGFRCDAAYQVPADFWNPIIDGARSLRADCLMCAETLGCTPEQVAGLKDAGFDYLFNSSKWWDFREPWLLDQYESFRSIAPSIAFPETHDTDRLINESGTGDLGQIEKLYRLRYLFAAVFSSGVMSTIGYEYGFAKRLHVVASRPKDWEREFREARFDLTGFIADTNAMKAGLPVLNREGPQYRTGDHDLPVLALMRHPGGDAEAGPLACLTVINPDRHNACDVDPAKIVSQTGAREFTDITPQSSPMMLQPGRTVRFEPLEIRVFSFPAA